MLEAAARRLRDVLLAGSSALLAGACGAGAPASWPGGACGAGLPAARPVGQAVPSACARGVELHAQPVCLGTSGSPTQRPVGQAAPSAGPPAPRAGSPPLTDGRLFACARECLGDELRVYPDGRMLVWDLARHDGYDIPPYPMAGCGDAREFLSDEGARDVPDWYERHLGMSRERYERMYEVELVMVRNRRLWRRVWQVPASTMASGARLGGPLWQALAEWLAFALGAQTSADDSRLFRR